MRTRKRISLLLLTVVAAVGAAGVAYKGCGCAGTPEGWTEQSAPTQPAELMAGAWRGSWASDSKPIGGKLSAVIEKLPDGTYKASFDAQTALGLSHKSVCIFRIVDRGEVWAFEGSEDLGLLQGGTYRYQGTVDGKDFVCTYDSTFDKGVFRMKRDDSDE